MLQQLRFPLRDLVRVHVELARQLRKGLLAAHRVYRFVPLLPPVAAALQEHQGRQKLERLMLGAAWQGESWGGLLFTNETGGPLSGEYALHHFHDLTTPKPTKDTLTAPNGLQEPKASLPPIRLRDLRHAAASLLAAAGIPPRDVMDLLGHSTSGTTLGMYTHVMPELRREAMDRLGRVLWPNAEA